MFTLDKMKTALWDMKDLHQSVEEGYHVPIRFRKMTNEQFMKVERHKYLKYLKEEIVDLTLRISDMEKGKHVIKFKTNV